MILTVLKLLVVFMVGMITGSLVMLYRLAYLHRKFTGKDLGNEIKEDK